MGTRSLTIVLDEGKENMVMYGQFDGYPEGHGKALFDKFGNHKIVNGYLDQTSDEYANGMGCLAAQIVSHFKSEIGNFYLYPSGTHNTGEEYIYYLYLNDGSLCMKIVKPAWEFKDRNHPEKVLYDAPIDEFGKWMKKHPKH